MNKAIGIVGIASLVFGLLLTACEKKAVDQPEPAKDTAAAQPAAPATAPAPAAAAAKDMGEAMKAAGANPDDAPEYLKKMVGHMKEINQLTKDNLADCNKVAEEVQKYVKANEEELKTLSAQAEEAKKTMTDTDKAKMAQSVMALIAPIMQEMMTTQSQFMQKCPEQSVAVNEAMKNFKVR
jgi:hypothetical protein